MKSILTLFSLFIATSNLSIAGVSDDQLKDLTNTIKTAYAKDLRNKSLKVKFEHRESDTTVNGYSRNSGGIIHVTLLGGLTQHKKLSEDGIAAIACYELGRHIGGSPYRSHSSLKRVSTVAQSEYFTGVQCLKRIFYNDDNIEKIKNIKIDPLVKILCRGTQANEQESALCIRISYAGLQVATFLQSIRKESNELRFGINTAPYEDKIHPSVQCRLENYFQGALCNQDPFIEIKFDEFETGFCTRSKGYTYGVRPSCGHKVKKN